MNQRPERAAVLVVAGLAACGAAVAQSGSTDAQACGQSGCQENTGVLSASATSAGSVAPGRPAK